MGLSDNVDCLTNSRRRTLLARLFKSTSTHSADANQQYKNHAPSKVKLIIHHQFPGVRLVSPVYACDGAKCYLAPDHRVVVGSTTYAGFKIDFSLGEPTGILMYELKRKNKKQSTKDATSSEDETICTRLYIAWKIINSNEFCVFLDVINHDKGRAWNRDHLMKLVKCCNLYDIQHIPIGETRLMHNNTVLMERVNVTREEECYKLEVTISETSIKYDTLRPRYINANK
jgi:hypothetical protein